MKLASVIGAVIQTHNLFGWQFDLSPDALPNCSATQISLTSEKAEAYSYKSHQSHGGNPTLKKPILQCHDHVLASTCSTSQDTAPLYSCQMWCDSAGLLFKENKSLESNIIFPITHPPRTNPYAPISDIWQHSDPSGSLACSKYAQDQEYGLLLEGFLSFLFIISSFAKTTTSRKGIWPRELFIYFFPRKKYEKRDKEI